MPFSVAPTRLVPAHSPDVPAVQSVRDAALLIPPGTARCAVPSVWVRQPVPVHSAVVSTTSFEANPPVAEWQAPAVQVALDVPFTPFAPVTVVRLEVRVAQPAAVPLSQSAPTEAEVRANRSSGSASGALVVREALAVICARHAVVPSHRDEPVAVLVLRSAPVPAAAEDDPVTVPVQPASGQSSWELASATRTSPGSAWPSRPRHW
ncbi:hypothetical protein BJF90_22070 [Pseudonocardia sp. CNS-004]|nr:hypothetical protein BJF90_22070 [Pseudonocardia sp. CNS-004]